MTDLVPYVLARAALAEAKTVDDVKDILDKAAAMAEYRRRAEDWSLMFDALEIKMFAERRLGQMIDAQKKTTGLNRGGRPSEKTGSSEEPVFPTLADVGINKKLSSRAQKMAALAPHEFEAKIAAWRQEAEITDRVVTNLLHVGRKEEQAQSRKDLAQTLSDKSHELTGVRTFPCIYMDPAYSQKGGIGDRAYENQYPTEKWERIIEILKLAAPRLQPNGWLFCWVPRAHMFALHESEYFITVSGDLHSIKIKIPLAYAIARAIDPKIEFSTAFVWTKTDDDHPDEHGTFRICKDQDEILLMWKKGNGLPKPSPENIFGSNHRERSRPLGHSRKPQYYREMIQKMTGGLPVLELFARFDEKFPLPENWEAWGNESQSSDGALTNSLPSGESGPSPMPASAPSDPSSDGEENSEVRSRERAAEASAKAPPSEADPEVSEPPKQDVSAHGAVIDPSREEGLRGGSLAPEDPDSHRWEDEGGLPFGDDLVILTPGRRVRG